MLCVSIFVFIHLFVYICIHTYAITIGNEKEVMNLRDNLGRNRRRVDRKRRKGGKINILFIL